MANHGYHPRTFYDALGRTTKTVDDYTDGIPTDASNHAVEYTYDGNGNVLTLSVNLPGGGAQTTSYVYGVATSAITSNDLLAAVRHPDKATGAASATEADSYTYDALGERVTATDRNLNTHTYAYDVLGRPVSDSVTTLGSGVDGQVRRIGTTYNVFGSPVFLTSYDAAGGVVKQVLRDYNGLDQLVAEYQSHAGVVDTATTPATRYAYGEMAGESNNSRLVGMTYPDGRILHYGYNSGLDDAISRLSFLADDNGSGGIGTHLEEYRYLGAGTIVIRSQPEPGVELTYVKQSGEANGDAGDPYTGLDRFGRVVDQRWRDTSTGAATDRTGYGYDRDGNRTFRTNALDSALDELYGYDAFNQLTSFDRGTLSDANSDGTPDTVASPTRSQGWDLDALGNWAGVTTDGTTEARVSNRQNELTTVGGAALGYDGNGNTTNDGDHLTTYDAWNRAIVVSSAATSAEQVRYAYDALGRRIIEATAASGAAAPESVWIEEGTDYENAEWSSAGAGWSFTLGGGLTADGSGFTLYAAGAPAGAQVAFLQGLGSFSQQVDDWAAGSYTIGFLAAQRGNYLTSHEDFQVEVDGIVVGTFTPTGTTYASYATASFPVAAGSHMITFQGVNSLGGDNTAFIDSVSLSLVAPPPVVTLANAGFEAPVQATAGFSSLPADAGWTFHLSGGIAGNGSGFTVGNPSAPEGAQVAYLQSDSDFSQAVAGWAAGTYAIRFRAAQRGSSQDSPLGNDFQVEVDGVSVGIFRPASSAYAEYSTRAFTVAAGTHTVTFRGLDSVGGDNTVLFDDIRVTLPAVALADAGFEAYALGYGVFVVNPTLSDWTFHYSGVSNNGSAFTYGSAVAPDGAQVAFLQESSDFSQVVAGWAAGTYTIGFLAAQRGNHLTSHEDFQIEVDGTVVGTFNPTGTSYAPYSTAGFTVAAGSHTITFQGLNSLGGDNTAFIDEISIASVSSATPAPTLNDPSFETLPVGYGVIRNGAWLWGNSAPAPYSGMRDFRQAPATGLHQLGTTFASPKPIATGDILFAWVYIDASNPPTEVMLEWRDASGSWEHRAYWGTDAITDRGVANSASRYLIGTLPDTGTWVQLPVPAALVGLVGTSVTAMSFTLYDGGATWDHVGVDSAPPTAATTTDLYYTASWQVIEERRNGTAASNVYQQYVWGAAYIDELVLRDRDADGTGGTLEERLYVQQDANWDVTALVNASGAVVERFAYDPYGAVTVLDESGTPRLGNASAYDWQYLHRGGRLDEVSGLYNFRHRDYSPTLGRWTSEDPLGLGVGEKNMYRYTGNCPAVYLDPTGLAGIFFDGAWQQPNSATTIQDLWNRYKGPKSLFTKIDPFAYKQEIEKALQFCEAERAKNPNEPIDIFGWSRGGYYGFRLVHELSNKGIPVRFVGLIDPVSNPNPAYPLNIPSNVSTIFIALTDGETAGDTILDSTIFSDMQISQNPDWVLTASTQNFYPIGHRQSGFPSNPPGAAIRDDLRARASKCGATFVP